MGSIYASKSASSGSVYAQKGSSGGSVYASKGGGASTAPAKPGGGFLHSLAKYSGAEFAGNLGKDIGATAVGVFPGIYHVGKIEYGMLKQSVEHPWVSGKNDPNYVGNTKAGKEGSALLKGLVQGYKDYYGHHLGSHLYNHPLQPILDALTVADLGSTAGVRAGLLSGERASLVTRSPRAMATGKGPVHADLSSVKPLVRAREVTAAKIRQKFPEGIGKGPVKVGGELKAYGKQIQASAAQHALGHLNDYQPYLKATRHLSQKEWAALHIRAMDIHPDDLTQLWKGTPAEKFATDAKVRKLALEPSKKIVAAETAAQHLSAAGEKLYKGAGRLKDETADARPDLTKRQATEALGRPVQEIHGKPYYLPHVIEDARKPPNPLTPSGGGKGIAKATGATKQNLGVLFLRGKLHLRGDVLGPEFLRRVKFVKYDEIHNALTRGAVRVTKQQLDEHYGGKLPAGYEYMRTKPGQKIPATMRAEGDQHVPIDKLIPNAEDLHDSPLAKEGFSTTDPEQAHTVAGHYYIVPKNLVKAATGEFTRSSDFTHNFVKKPLSVWRSAVLGLRVGFLTNNLVGNSVMYAVKTGGRGALRDLFGAILDEHGPAVAKKALDSAATPPELRQSLYKEFFPEQMHGTFGRTQSPSASRLGEATGKAGVAWQATTGAIPKLTSAVAETGFRKALIHHYIRHSPEFKAVYTSLPKQTRTFEAAARQVLEGKTGPAFQRYISKQVNQALGDYLNLSPVERNVLRNALPFYAWYKAITTTTFHLAADTPLRANILGQIGQIGKQWSDQQLGDVPSFLEGSIPLGDGKNGTKRVLSTQSLNPYATLEQLRRALTGDVSGLGLNPFLQGTLDTYAKASQHGGKIAPADLAVNTLKDIGANLPLVRLALPQKPSKLYPNRDRKSTALSYLGAPVKEYNPLAAALQKKQGR